MTTIKVTKELHRALAGAAREEGLTPGQFIERLTRDHARRLRFAAVERAHAAAPDAEYTALTDQWDAAGGGPADA